MAYLRVQRAYKFLIYEANISKTDPVTLFFLMQNSIQKQKWNALCTKL